MWVYILKNKSQVFEKFVEWKVPVENLYGCKIKNLRTDNGGEYTSNEFTTYLKQEGIRYELTVPKTPQQNGVAERMNRTLVETVHSMLSDTKLPKQFWAEALSTAVYLRNRSPTRFVLGKTPFESLTEEKPFVGHFKIFGSLCYTHVNTDEREKFDVRARRCIMLGYGTETKAYWLYDLEKKNIIFSRDVVFDETKIAIKEDDDPPKNESGKKFVQLDCLSENETLEEQPSPQVEEPSLPLRYSTREQGAPDVYEERVTIAETSSNPTSFQNALDREDKSQWINAMGKKLGSLSANEVWDLVELPEGRRIVGSKWVFKTKKDANGAVERYKARLVAQGCSQKYGQDYDETFSPVVRFESIRIVIALAVQLSNGCCHSIPEWRAQRRYLHEAT